MVYCFLLKTESLENAILELWFNGLGMYLLKIKTKLEIN